MTRIPRMAALAGALVALSPLVDLADAEAQASKQPIVLMVNDADPADRARINDEGRLRKTDEEGTNEMGVVKFFADGKRGLYVEMRTGALSGQRPVHNVQDACTPLELVQAADGSVNLIKNQGERFVTDNDGNEYRNGNKPELMPINGGKNMLLMFNYQPDGDSDTIRYAKVLDQSCNEVAVRDASGSAQKQVEIMHKNNDDCDMHQSGEGPCDIATDADGSTHLTCWAGCNGNGRDDGWINDLTVRCTNGAGGTATSCTIEKNFDMSLAQREERSRGRCSVADADPDTAICTWTEGNNQPQRDGTWIAAVDISAGGERGENASSRLLWKEQFDGRKQTASGERTYSVRANQARVMQVGADGSLERTDLLFMMTGDLQGSNRDNRKGGTYRAQQFAVLRATRDGLSTVVPEQDLSDLLVGIDATHLTACPALVGEGDNLVPAISLLQGSHNGGGVQEPNVKLVGWDRTGNKLVDLGTQRAGGSYDRHLYSNYLGNNPGNQGRNFAGCTLVKNPFAGQNGNTTAYFLAHAMTGKSPANVGDASLKPSSYVSLLPVATIAAAATGPARAPGETSAAPLAPTAAAVVEARPGSGPGAGAALAAIAAAPALDMSGAQLALLVIASVGIGAVVVLRPRGTR